MKSLKIAALVSSALIMCVTTASFAQPEKFSRPEIDSLADIAVIDKAEILMGVVAQNKSPSSDVADFAKMMIDQHGSNLTQILDMVSGMHLPDLKAPKAEELMKQSAKEMLAIGGMQGAQFEKAYIDAMVKGHEAALKLIDDHLMKSAKSDEIKKFLTDTRAAVVNHLDHAKKVQEKLNS